MAAGANPGCFSGFGLAKGGFVDAPVETGTSHRSIRVERMDEMPTVETIGSASVMELVILAGSREETLLALRIERLNRRAEPADEGEHDERCRD